MNEKVRITRALLYMLPLIFLMSCSRIDTLENKVKDLESKISLLQTTTKILDFQIKADQFAYLTPGSEAFSTIKTDNGFIITIALINVQSYANGSKILLRLGNPMSATINNLNMKIEWGTVDKKGLPDNENAKSQDFTVTKDLLSGSWTTVSIILEGVPPKDLGFVRIKDVVFGGIALRDSRY